MTGPHELWKQAGGGTPEYDPERYRELLEQHGHIVPGPPQPLPCGHDLIGPSPQQRIDGMGSDPAWDEAIANVDLSAVTGHDTRRDQITEAIDDGLSRIYGTFVDSTTPGQLAHLLAPLVMPILDAAVTEARTDTAEAIAKEIPNQSARVIREHEPRPHGCVCGAVFGDDIDRRWHLVNQALAAATDIARQHAGRCCDLHNRNCEPPSELCCWACTEANHPDHPPGEQCIAPDLSGSGQP